MARSEGLALAPWNVIAAGKFRTDDEEERRRQTGEKGRTTFDPNWERNEKEKKVSKALEKVAGEVGVKHISAGTIVFPGITARHSLIDVYPVAIAYVLQKTTYVFPLVGGRKVEHLEANIEALSISLSEEQIKYLESATDFDLGFPLSMIVSIPRSTKDITVIDQLYRAMAQAQACF